MQEIKDALDTYLAKHGANEHLGRHPDVLAVTEAIAKEPRLNLFENHLQQIGNGAGLSTHLNLSDWLVRRSQEVDVPTAVTDLETYLEEDEFEVFVYTLQADVWLNEVREYQFRNGVVLGMPERFPSREIQEIAFGEFWGSRAPTSKPMACLYSPRKAIKHHTPSAIAEGEERTESSPLCFADEDNQEERHSDVLFCLSIVASDGRGVHPFAMSTCPGKSIPIGSQGVGFSLIPALQPKLGAHFVKRQLDDADELLGYWLDLDPSVKQKLRVPIARFNNYNSNRFLVDRAIELRVAIDAFFGDLSEGEVAYKVRLRAAKYLGGTLEEKRKILGVFKKAYNLSSKAVHNGEFTKIGKTDPLASLSECASYLQLALRKFVFEGGVDWQKFDLDEEQVAT